MPTGRHVLYVLGTRTSLGRAVRTAYRGTPGSTCMVRNVQLRNIAMCKENREFAAALVSLDDAQRAQCSRVCSVLRVDANPNPGWNPNPDPSCC